MTCRFSPNRADRWWTAAALLAVMVIALLLRGPLLSLGQPAGRQSNRLPDTRQQPPRIAQPTQPQTPAQQPQVNRQQLEQTRRRERIGLMQLAEQLGRDMPTGRGVKIDHVEGLPGNYLPNLGAARYDRIDARAMSGPSEAFGHVESTARIIYGRSGLAPGVDAVDFYAMSDWIGRGFLRAGTPLPPLRTDARVMTHSWIGQTNPLAEEILARVDYVVDTQDVVVVVGVNNGRGSAIPPLLGSAYNVIAVGAWSGNNSAGPTTFAGGGRSKPDLTAPGGQTSYSTPVVAAGATLLIEAADRFVQATPEVRRAEVVKAVLLTGAVKPEGWSADTERPLDRHFGAGRMRIDRSYAVLAAGRAVPRTSDAAESASHPRAAGWDFRALDVGGDAVYEVEVPDDGSTLSITAVWHRRVAGNLSRDPATGRPRWNDFARVADFDMTLAHQADDGTWQPAGESRSRVDNVEHIHLPTAEPGLYRLTVQRQDRHADAWDVAIAFLAAPPASVSTDAGNGSDQTASDGEPDAAVP